MQMNSSTKYPEEAFGSVNKWPRLISVSAHWAQVSLHQQVNIALEGTLTTIIHERTESTSLIYLNIWVSCLNICICDGVTAFPMCESKSVDVN